MAEIESKVTISADSSQAEQAISKVSTAIAKDIPASAEDAAAKVAKEANAMFAPFIAEMEKVVTAVTENMGNIAVSAKATADSSRTALSAVSDEMAKIAQTAKTELGQNATSAIVSAGKRTGEAFKPATEGMGEVATTAKRKLGGDVVDELDKVATKAQKAIGQDLKSVFSQVIKGIQFAGAVTGITLAATAMKDVAVAASSVSDQMAQIRSRINLINDGTQTTSEIMDKIYSAAQRSRGGYLEMADSVAKLNMLAKDAFSSNDEAIVFVEQLNKQFKISGASVDEAKSAMYQLTQAMAAGKLQGDEFRSIMENAPMLAQSIAKQMGLSVGQLKEMSSQGLITADIIKNALFSSAEETNAKFAEIPMTFAEVGVALHNEAIASFQPVLTELANLTANGDFKTALEGVGVVFRAMAATAQVAIAGIAGAFNVLKTTISTISSIVKSFAQLFITTMPAITAAVVGVTAGFIAYRATMALVSAQTALLTTAQVAMAAKQLVVNAATKAGTAVMVALRVATSATMSVMGLMTATTAALRAGFVAYRGAALGAAAAQRVVNAVMKANPIGLLVSVLITLATVFGTAAAASNGFGNTMSAVWSSVVHTAVWGVNKIIEGLNWLIAKLNSVGDKVAKFFGGTFTAIQQVDTISAETAQSIVNKGEQLASQVAQGLTAGGDLDIGDSGGGSDAGGGAGGKGGSSSKGEDLAKEAKQVHEKILQSYMELQGQKLAIIDIEYDKELEELNKSKAANEHYEEDLTKLQDIYANKRIQAKAEEMARIREIANSVRDMVQTFNFNVSPKDSTGSQSPMTKLVSEYNSGIDAISDRWNRYADDYAQMNQRDKDEFLKNLNAKGVAYEKSQDGILSFEQMINSEKLALTQEYNMKAAQMHRELQEEKWAIDEAMRAQNFEALQQALSDEYIARQQSYDLQKQLMEEYYQAVMDSNWNSQQVLFDTANAGIEKMQEGISGLLQGTMSLSQAFQNMGKALLKTIADAAAQWIAAQMKQMIFGKMMQSQQAASSIALAQAQTPAWATLAQQMSMATFGLSATTGMAAYTAASAMGTAATASMNSLGGGLSSLFKGGSIGSMPKLAEGGLAYGSTIAEIGEGKYREAVLPLSESVYSEIGEGINRAGGQGVGGGITLNVSAIDADSFGTFLENRGGRALRQFLVNQDREFVDTAGTW